MPTIRLRRFAQGVLTLACLAGSALAAPPGVRHIRADAAPGGDGLSWATAYKDLRQALITAGSSGGAISELWVKEGVHTPDVPGGLHRTYNFTLASGVGVYGGFAGVETTRDERDPVAHPTTLSGMLSASTSVYNVVVGAGDASAILDGFTIRDGRANKPRDFITTHWAGGGIHVTGSPTIRNCTITANTCGSSSSMGAGVACAQGSSPTFIDCAFINNSTPFTAEGVAGAGGGLALEIASARLIRCAFRDNRAADGAHGLCAGGEPVGPDVAGLGGGIYAIHSSLVLENCVIDGNRAGTGGPGGACGSSTFAGIAGGHGGGFYARTCSIVAINCIFTRNHAGDGGDGASGPGPAQPGGAGGSGGGLYATTSFVELVNCTFADNSVGAGGTSGGSTAPDGPAGDGPSVRADPGVRLENCIAWGDEAASVFGPVASYSNIRGGYPGAGNINVDPRFIDRASGDYRLAITSPCIDAGNSSADADPAPGVQPLPAADADGLPRRADIATVVDTGVGSPVVDMGAYEVQPCTVDLNGDGVVDFTDYLEFLNLFDAQDLRVDFNHDGVIDFGDYLEFLNLFDAGC